MNVFREFVLSKEKKKKETELGTTEIFEKNRKIEQPVF